MATRRTGMSRLDNQNAAFVRLSRCSRFFSMSSWRRMPQKLGINPTAVKGSIIPIPIKSVGGSPENFVDLSRHRVDVGHAVDPAQNAAIAIIGQDRRGLTMIDLEAGLDRLGPVVSAADEFAAPAYVADALVARSVIPLVRALCAL